MKKWLGRSFLISACLNFALSIWFAQYLTTGWLLYVYVIGSFALMCVSMVFAE